MIVTKVYRYGCRAPRDPEHARLAEQLLGQAWLYSEELRKIYNDHTSAVKTALADRSDASAHVISWLHDDKRARIRAARDKRRRGHLLDAGTYWLVEAAIEQAVKKRFPEPVRRKRFDGTGRIGAMIQSKDQFPADRWEHPRVSLTKPNDEGRSRWSRGRAEVVIWVGELAEARVLRWAVKIHRPLPADGIVKQVAVQRIRIGSRYRWELLVTVTFDEERTTDRDARGIVGVDIGWRREPSALGPQPGEERREPSAKRTSGPADERTSRSRLRTSGPADKRTSGSRPSAEILRVATHEGSDGNRGALLIDALEAFGYADGVRSIRDKLFDDARDYAKSAKLPGGDHVGLWRDKERLRRLGRKTNDAGLLWWTKRDRHLLDIEDPVRNKAIRRRLDAFRIYADKLARRYRVLALEDMPMADWVGEGQTKRLERGRSAAALSLLQDVLVQRFGPDRVDWVPAEYSTMTCAACGLVRPDPVGRAVMWTCECGEIHHQDENAAVVLRARCERWIDDGNTPRARGRKPANRKKKEKKAAVDEAAE